MLLENFMVIQTLWLYKSALNMCTFTFNSQILYTSSRDHSFRTYAKVSEKSTFLAPDTHTYVCVSGGKKCYFSENFVYVLNE